MTATAVGSGDVRAALRAVLDDALAAVDPAAATARALTRADVSARLTGRVVTIAAVGKAAHAMADGAVEALAARGVIVQGGLVVGPRGGRAGRAATAPGIEVRFASHPVPDDASESAGRALLALAAAVPASGLLLALVSGGASALAAVPAGGLPLAEKVARTTAVARAGASIRELNAVRVSLSAIKGGRLAAACAAPVVTVVCSDVVGDDPAVVGSGPTVGPAAVGRSDDAVVVASGISSLAAAVAAAVTRRLPGLVTVVDEAVEGEVEALASKVVEAIRGAEGPSTLIWAGEPTLCVPTTAGRGGRARHVAALVAGRLAERGGWTLLAAGSDGVDGTADAAGAIVDGGTWARSAAAGVDADAALAGFDVGRALAAAGDAVVTGPTGVNHADLVVAHVVAAAC